jgi:putative transposase
MEIKKEVLDELIKDYKKPEDLIGEAGLLKQLTKALLERAMSAELTQHLGYEKHDPAGYNSGNSRNGKTPKTVKGDFGQMVVETPRDRQRQFRAADPAEAPDALRWIRRQDSIDVRARYDDARDPRSFVGDVRGGGKELSKNNISIEKCFSVHWLQWLTLLRSPLVLLF